MSHLHIPDGLLPAWLWVSGFVLAGLAVLFALWMLRGMELKRKIPLLGMMSAVMLVGMNIEVAPYHVNLSVITGIMLGPWLSVVAALIVNTLMAMVGHGGVTVIGLNAVVLAAEATAGYYLFRLFRGAMRPGWAAGVSTVIALLLSTCIMLAIVYAGNFGLSFESAAELRELIGSGGTPEGKDGFNFRLFAMAALGLGAVGWVIEALVTAVAVRFISRVRPELLG